MGIFSDNAERYWAAGLPVMPLRPQSKRPVIDNWSAYQSRMPSDLERLTWKMHHGDGNIGLPLGAQSGLVAIDIDVDDPVVLGILDRVLPPSPWRRVGKKGKVLLYRYEGQPIVRVKYRDKNGATQTAVEMLSGGSQIVLPPSIHPDTGQPYYANRELLDCLGEIQSLPPNIEAKLREAMREAGYDVNASSGIGALTNFISSGARDNTLTSYAGLFANDVLKGHKTLLEACEQIEVAVTAFMQRTNGDNIDPKKGSKKLVEFLIRDVTGPKRKQLAKGWDAGLTEEQKKALGVDAFTTDHEEWDVSKVLAYFNAGLEQTGAAKDEEAYHSLTRDVLAKVASNPTFLTDVTGCERICKYIADLSGKRLTLSAVRGQLAAIRRNGGIEGVNHAEIAKEVKQDLEDRLGEIRWHNERLWRWCGSHWVGMPDGEILNMIANDYGHYRASSKHSDHNGILKTIKTLSLKPLRTLNENGINFVNGFLTEDLELRDHHPDFGMTYCLPYAYDPSKGAFCSKWHKMLNDYWGEDPDFTQKVQALGEVMAMTMFGKMPQTEKAVCLIGAAGSGKSRVLGVMKGLMPDDAISVIPPSTWGDKFAPAQMDGKLLNVAGELSEHAVIDGARFKQIVSGEEIDGQFKNKDMFKFRPRAAQWFASNHPPKSRDSSDGFTRRWLFLTFSRAFPKDQQNVDYEQIVLAEEREGIAAWAVAHMARLRNERYQLTDPASSVVTRERLENDLNNVRGFLVEMRDSGRLLLGPDAHAGVARPFTSFETIWTEYRSWAVTNATQPVDSRTLIRRMHSLAVPFGFVVDRVATNGGGFANVYKNLTLGEHKKAAA